MQTNGERRRDGTHDATSTTAVDSTDDHMIGGHEADSGLTVDDGARGVDSATRSTRPGDGSATATLPVVQESGLSVDEVRRRVEQGQSNAVDTATSRSLGKILRSHVFTLFNAIIGVAMVMVLLTGSWKDAVFGLVILINTGIGVFTELKAKRTLDRLSILVSSKPMVRRDGQDVAVAHDQIVLGDLLWVQSGEQVPADGEVVRDWGLELDESMLTGESKTVRKQPGDKVFSGSNAVSGMALIRVTAVGAQGYAAKLTAEAKVYKKTISDLNAGINTILKVMTVIVVPLCVALVWSQIHTVGGWQAAMVSGQWRQAVISAVAGVVGMIPEGLVLLTSLNFAIAAMRLARKNTLVQELESVETLARVDSLNLDKTGTITDGHIAMRGIEFPDVALEERRRQSSMEALFDLADEEHPNATGQAVLDRLRSQGMAAHDVSRRIPFSSARKWSAIVRDNGDIWYLGAPEVLISGFTAWRRDGTAVNNLMTTVNAHADQGERVLLVAYCPAGEIDDARGGASDGEPRLYPRSQPMALVLCAERIREDAEETLAWFRSQSVRCRVISGDNPATVGAIAQHVRLTGDRPVRAMDARELPEDVDALAKVLDDVDVLGRVLPQQKKAIVQALHLGGHVVAMTGDGVNDTLAIKEADLGIAMGNAAPAAKAVAQLVLVDSKFSHLPDVVARGRQVMANMERVASLFLVKTVYSLLISIGVVLTAIPFPYLPRHITYIGALTIGMPAFLLALGPSSRRYVPGFLRRVVAFAIPGGVAIGAAVLLDSWILPLIMGWNLNHVADLASLRATNSILVFILAIVVLARVSRPLRSWRGALVAVFAAAGVVGVAIPFVAHFFELAIPTGHMAVVTLLAVLVALALYGGCRVLAKQVERILPYIRNNR